MLNRTTVWTLAMMLGAVACSGSEPTSTDGSDVDLDTVAPNQTITSVNADGTWTANATCSISQLTCKPSFSWEGTAAASFTGPTGKTRKMGVCALLKSKTSAGAYKSCTTVADCSTAPASLPSGGSRYCTAPNGTGTKYCFHRPGPATSFCAGSPALSGNPAVAPGYYSVALDDPTPSETWISYGCFEGCSATDPSSSSAQTAAIKELWCN